MYFKLMLVLRLVFYLSIGLSVVHIATVAFQNCINFPLLFPFSFY